MLRGGGSFGKDQHSPSFLNAEESGAQHNEAFTVHLPLWFRLFPRFPEPDVTSALVPHHERADHCQSASSKNMSAQESPKSFVVKILTSKPLGLSILQTLFANPASVAASQRGGGGGYPKIRSISRIETIWKSHPNPSFSDFFLTTYPGDVASCTCLSKAIPSTHAG